MPVDRLEPLGTVQTIPEIPLNSRITNRLFEPHYECPEGKKAIFEGYATCTNLGGSSEAFLKDPTNTFNLCRWSNTGFQINDATFIRPNFKFNFRLELIAGEQIITAQNLGATNAEMEVIGVIQESAI